MNSKSLTAFPFTFARKGTKVIARLIGAAVLISALFVSRTVPGATPLKWNQPPAPADATNIFYGWNQPSTEIHGAGNLQAADDWVCISTNPVTKIRWWGSFVNWQGTNLPSPMALNGFWMVFFSDVPAGQGSPSHPGAIQNPLARYYTNFTWRFVGWDYDPKSGTYESCFLFEQDLATNWWFYQTNMPTGTNICWLSIIANQPNTNYYWGWKTRPQDTNSPAPDAAVTYNIDGYTPGSGIPYDFQPIGWPDPTNRWDLAFELITTATETTNKWEQPPDLSTNGVDVNATYFPPVPPPYLLADDFLCTKSGPITDITIWGSWWHDLLPDQNLSNNVVFTLSIHADIPASPPTNSMPGELLWIQSFGPGQFTGGVYQGGLQEGWLEPPSMYDPFADTTCYQYDFHIDPAYAFTQTNGVVYWLDVQAGPLGSETNWFGWKTSSNHWNDDAVYVNNTEYYNGPWSELRYPVPHPLAPNSIDLSFRIRTEQTSGEFIKWSQPPVPYSPTNAYNGWNEPSGSWFGQIVADDWACTNMNPVTDLHWWGSFLNWGEATPPQLPDSFQICFWTDVPLGYDPQAPFSHPGTCLQTITCTNYTWHFVGWDLDPRNPNAPPEACFRFDQDLSTNEWFYQTNTPTGTNIFWISIAAVYNGTQPPSYSWGWKTRPRDTNSLAPDDAVRIYNPLSPQPGTNYVSGTNIWWPDPAHSWDMAFALTSQELGTNEQHDLGDAPASLNHFALPMTAYPPGGPGGVLANFPTVLILPGPVLPVGPIHMQPTAVGFLGNTVSLEINADLGADQDGVNNINPLLDQPDNDGGDDGVVFPLTLPHGRNTTLSYNVTFPAPPPPQAPGVLFVNVWFDWNRDGDWNDAPPLPDGSTAPEWAVQNQPVLVPVPPQPYPLVVPMITPPFKAWHPSVTNQPVWMRITLAEQPCPPGGFAGMGVGGDGPINGYTYGETEDYYITSYDLDGTLDFGDAPSPYPTLLANDGARHYIVPGFSLGALEDAEANGLPDPLALGDDNNNLADEDGVLWPAVLLVNTQACVDVILTAGQGGGLLDAWVDFNGNGSWDTSAGEQIFTNRLLAPGTNAGLCFNVPTNAVLGTNFARFRLSSAGNLMPVGLAQDGEVEDYLVRIMQPGPATNIVVTNVVVTATNVTVQWAAENNVHYLLQCTANLRPTVVWTNVGPEVIGPAYQQTETNTVPRARFYRVIAPHVWP